MIGTAMKVTIDSLQESENMKIIDPKSMTIFLISTLTYRDNVFDIVWQSAFKRDVISPEKNQVFQLDIVYHLWTYYSRDSRQAPCKHINSYLCITRLPKGPKVIIL